MERELRKKGKHSFFIFLETLCNKLKVDAKIDRAELQELPSIRTVKRAQSDFNHSALCRVVFEETMLEEYFN